VTVWQNITNYFVLKKNLVILLISLVKRHSRSKNNSHRIIERLPNGQPFLFVLGVAGPINMQLNIQKMHIHKTLQVQGFVYMLNQILNIAILIGAVIALSNIPAFPNGAWFTIYQSVFAFKFYLTRIFFWCRIWERCKLFRVHQSRVSVR
jgi:hypothetical protein